MAPTTLDRGTRFQRQQDGRGKSLAYTKEKTVEEIPVNVTAPYGGYAPDLTDDLTTPSFADDCSGIIERDGDLVNLPGFSRLQNSSAADLPLGGASLPAAAADVEAVLGIFQAAKRDGAASYRIAVTAIDPSGGTVGHVYAWTGTAWSVIAPTTTAHHGVYTTTTANLVDFAYFPWAADASYTGTSGQIFFVNGLGTDVVYGYPDNNDDYFEVGLTGTAGDTNAASISNYFSRVCLFNVTENGTNFPHRFMWFAPASLDLATAGSGYFDVDEVQGPGLRCLPIADNNALYFGRGVAFVSRSGSQSAPFRVDYISKQRGLVGPKAVCSIGAGSHFGIFTDGWLILDANGQFTELGVLNISGRVIHKWRNTFYDDLSATYANRTTVGFDADNHVIIISYASKENTSGHPDRTLYYDMKSDTLWPADFGDNAATAFGEFDSSVADISWDAAPGDWDDAIRAWNVDVATGRYQIIHGTYGGLVFSHSRVINTLDSQPFTSRYRSKKSKGLSYESRNIYDKLVVEYQRVATSTDILDLSMTMDDSVSTRSIVLSKGGSQTNQIDFMTNRMSGRRFGWGVSGLAPLRVKGVQMNVFIESDNEIEHGE